MDVEAIEQQIPAAEMERMMKATGSDSEGDGRQAEVVAKPPRSWA